MAIHSFEIGATYGSRVNVETLSTTPGMSPRSQFIPYGETLETLDRSRSTRGAATAIWTWGFMPADMFAALRLICTGASTTVNIRTLQEDYSTYAYYDCTMVWPEPDSYEYRGGLYQPFELRFEGLALYTPST